MKSKRNLLISATFLGLLAALAVGQSMFSKAEAQAAGTVMAPRFEVDPMWPKPLPNGVQFGTTIGVAVDAQDHVWIVHRSSEMDAVEAARVNKTGLCCEAAKPIIEFDQPGNMLRSWGGEDGPGYQWPASNHGAWVDHKGAIWIGGNGGGNDGHILKFTLDGKFLLQSGIKKTGLTADSNSMDRFYQVAKVHVHAKTNEVFVADGYGNRRVAVLDADTGKIKRYWGAYGNKPDDSPLPPYVPGAPLVKQFRSPVHCAEPTNDGFVYACDRVNDRVQVFTLEGKYVNEFQVMPDTRGDGSVWDIGFSTDPAQKYMYVADGRSAKIHIYDRLSLTALTSFGSGGHYPGQWQGLHSLAVDSKGNIYTTETYQGRRVQKFTYKGLAAVRSKDQGVVWPASTN